MKTILNVLFWGSFTVLVILLISLLLSMLWVMKSPSAECYFMSLTGVDESKPQLLMFMGWGVGGLVAILGVMGSFHRTSILDNQNTVAQEGHKKQYDSSNKQNKIMRENQIQERKEKASERLGSEHALVRIASFNDFYYLAAIEPNLRRYSFDILCAHLRQITKYENDQKRKNDLEKSEAKRITPTEEVQSLLNILFKPYRDEGEDKFIFDGLVANLEGVYLQGANLQDAHLQKAILQDAILIEANLQNAILTEANLEWANLKWADMKNAQMEEAEMKDIILESAILTEANLQKAFMRWAKLQNTKLQNANLQGAVMREAKLQGAFMQGANLKEAFMLESEIDKTTTMPEGWQNMVKINEDGKTGALLVDGEGNVIENL